MFVDALAMVAILTRDPNVDALDGARSPITSALAVFEATLGICRKRHASVTEAEADVLELLATARLGHRQSLNTWSSGGSKIYSQRFN